MLLHQSGGGGLSRFSTRLPLIARRSVSMIRATAEPARPGMSDGVIMRSMLTSARNRNDHRMMIAYPANISMRAVSTALVSGRLSTSQRQMPARYAYDGEMPSSNGTLCQ